MGLFGECFRNSIGVYEGRERQKSIPAQTSKRAPATGRLLQPAGAPVASGYRDHSGICPDRVRGGTGSTRLLRRAARGSAGAEARPFLKGLRTRANSTALVHAGNVASEWGDLDSAVAHSAGTLAISIQPTMSSAKPWTKSFGADTSMRRSRICAAACGSIPPTLRRTPPIGARHNSDRNQSRRDLADHPSGASFLLEHPGAAPSPCSWHGKPRTIARGIHLR